MVRKLGAVAAVAMTLILAGCKSSAAPRPGIAVQSPINTALSWFKAINEHNMPLVLEHFARADRNQMESVVDVDSYSFYDLRCRLIAKGMTTSWVRCMFKMHNPSPPEMLDVTYWSVYMQRKPPGPWLITGYGQP